ncbi:MAG: winged helix-turn-helix domain-containing protein [[Clostridium] scindens]
MDHPGHTFSKQQLFQEVWKNDGSDNNTILVYIKNLRSKDSRDRDPSQPFHMAVQWYGESGYQPFL